MLYLIGLNHRAQARAQGAELTHEQKMFAECLRRTIARVRPALVAEEDSEEALTKRAKISIAKEIADETKIAHRFCDPNEAERVAMGYRDGQALELDLFMNNWEELSNEEIFCKARAIEIGRYFPLRERFWLERLNGRCGVDAIFICGDFHVESFGKILKNNGLSYEVVARGINLTEEDARSKMALEYLRQHPELTNG